MRRFVAALTSIALLLSAAVTVTSAAGPSRQYERPSIRKIDPSFRPFLADAARSVTVVVQLTDDPASVAPGLTKAERKARAETLEAGQSKLDGTIRSLGGKIVDRFQYAYNGVKVQIAANRLADLAAMPGVVGIRGLRTYNPTNTNAVPYVNAPTVWDTLGQTGAGQTIAIIDTGVDYTHANFGGPGTPEAYAANDPTIVETGTFPTAKVIDGYDFAGNAYDADNPASVPAPDADPLDCNSHGTHVAGTAAGAGVKADRSTFTGPYNATTLADPTAFVVGPGVAPEAKLVALKVFGCDGSTNLVVDALEWVAAYNVSHADAIDVVNMSLGSLYGSADDPDAVATDNLVETGVVVVASAGNSGDVPFITGSPAAATQAISVAALDAFPSIPLALVDLPDPAVDVAGNNQNAYPALPVAGTLHVLANGSGGVKLGCSAADYDSATAGTIVAVKRGVCAFVTKGELAQAAGAIGIIVINRDDTAAGALPTFIGYNPELFTIPMVGVDKLAQPSLLANEGAAITLAPNGTIPNPTYRQVADFSSAGPRYGDNALKPDVAAPGVNLLSSLNGSGWNGTTFSGTSMAAPMTSGTAALVRAAHPDWSPLKVKAALVNTADADSAIIGYDPLIAGSGVIQANRAADADVVATTSDGTASLSYGYEPSDGAYSETKKITIWNDTDADAWYNLSASSTLVKLSPASVRVPAHGSATVKATAKLSKSAVAGLPTADQFLTGAFGEVDTMRGVVIATPASAGPGLYALRVPYLLVPRGLSRVEASLSDGLDATGGSAVGSINVRNSGVHFGVADVYALGLQDRARDGEHGIDLRAAGVQTLPVEIFTGTPDPNDAGIQFAINSWDRFSTQSPNEIDIAIDTNGDGDPDRYVIGIDEGLIFTGDFDGIYLSLIFDANFNLLNGWLADAPSNGSTVILPALASDLGLTPGDGSFTYEVAAFDGFTGAADFMKGKGSFDPFDPAQTTGDFVFLAAKDKVSIPVSADLPVAKKNGGWLVVTLDDANGADQADIVKFRVNHRPRHGSTAD